MPPNRYSALLMKEGGDEHSSQWVLTEAGKGTVALINTDNDGLVQAIVDALNAQGPVDEQDWAPGPRVG